MSSLFWTQLTNEEYNFFKRILPLRHSLKQSHKIHSIPSKQYLDDSDKKDDKKGNIDPYKKCLKIIALLKNHPSADPFLDPVDHILLGIPNYFEIIRNPMDLSSVEAKLKGNKYKSPFQFLRDIELIWSNAFLFNAPDSDVHKMCEDINKDYLQMKKREFGEFLELEQNLKDTLEKMKTLFGEEGDQYYKEFNKQDKEQLLKNIKELPLKHQSGLQKIIQYGHPEYDFSQETKIDLNMINDETLSKIYKYINRCKRLENQRKKTIQKTQKYEMEGNQL